MQPDALADPVREEGSSPKTGDYATLGLGLVAVSVAAGSASAFFLWALDQVTRWRWAEPRLLGLLPFVGVALWAGYRCLGRNSDQGNALVLAELRGGQPQVPARLAPAVLMATLLTHIGGGSAGREGTAVQMGAGLASGWAQVSPGRARRWRRLWLRAGVAGGFGSVFGTPWAGALFALEFQGPNSFFRWSNGQGDELPDSFQRWIRTVLSLLGVAWLAHQVCLAWGIQHTRYPSISSVSGTTSLLLAGGVGLAAGVVARGYLQISEGVGSFGRRWLPWEWSRPVVGAVMVLGISYLLGTDAYLGLGVHHPRGMEPSLLAAFQADSPGTTPWSWWWKLLLTAITLGSGFKGGEVTPLLFVGAALGHAVAGVLNLPLMPAAAVGMVAVFAGASRTPFACTIMGMELFGWSLGPLALGACLLAFATAGPRGLYSAPPRVKPGPGDTG